MPRKPKTVLVPGGIQYHNGKPVNTEIVTPTIPEPKPEKKSRKPKNEIVTTAPVLVMENFAHRKHDQPRVIGFDLFGESVIADEILRDRYVEPPFTVLDSKQKRWRERVRLWKSKGIQSEIGRTATAFNSSKWMAEKPRNGAVNVSDVSIFDPVLTEVLYNWFCPVGGSIIDPFAGGSVRGIVANYLGYKYTGIDIRPEQIESNALQAENILPAGSQPMWIIGDSKIVLPTITNQFDFLFSCPPYGDLETYSDLPGDISNMNYPVFLSVYRDIITKSCALLKPGHYAIFVVGEFRDKKDGYYRGFVPDTIAAFRDAGMMFYNEAILLNSVGDAAMRADGNMKYQKLVKLHQNILCFKKPL